MQKRFIEIAAFAIHSGMKRGTLTERLYVPRKQYRPKPVQLTLPL